MANRSVHNHNNNSLHGSTQRNEGYGLYSVQINGQSPRQNPQQYPQHQGYPQPHQHPPQQAAAGQNQLGARQPQQGNGAMSDQRAKSVLREAVDAVVNSFAKHTQGYGRGKILIKLVRL